MDQGHTPRLSPTANPGTAPEDEIREELERVLASHEFRATKRSQAFLRYVVENKLGGRADTLKERTIGVDVFGRQPSYDPSDDATVRVKAGEVRRRLSQYYATEGARDPIRIDLPAGTYVPEFQTVRALPSMVESIGSSPRPKDLRRSDRWAPRKVQSVSVLFVLCLAASLLWWGRSHPAVTVLDEFWKPVLRGTSPVALCAAYVQVWNLERDPKSTTPVQIDDFVHLTDQFVGGGDLIAVARISAMLTRRQRAYNVRIGNEMSLSDLRNAPSILIGYSQTQWKEMSKELRFFIDIDQRPLGVSDHGARTKWNLPNLPRDHRTGEDYAIISRVFHPDTHAMLVELAGITQYGTDAAADLVTNVDLITEALRDSPPGWQSKNLQLVLHVKVISGAPTSPRIVATHFW